MDCSRGYLSLALFRQFNHGIVVSCQAPMDSPLNDPYVIAAMAYAAEKGGAAGVRIDSPEHIRAVRSRCSIPIIGLWKQQSSSSEVYITPQACHAQAVAEAGADIIAIDATHRDRPEGETLTDLIQMIHNDLQKPVLADIDTIATALDAAGLGADAIATTLCGYTAETQTVLTPHHALLQSLLDNIPLPIILEGRVSSPNQANQALNQGAWCVVIGSDITGIDHKIKQYCQQAATTIAQDVISNA